MAQSGIKDDTISHQPNHVKLPSFLPTIFSEIYQKINILKKLSTFFPSGRNYSNQEDHAEENSIKYQFNCVIFKTLIYKTKTKTLI